MASVFFFFFDTFCQFENFTSNESMFFSDDKFVHFLLMTTTHYYLLSANSQLVLAKSMDTIGYFWWNTVVPEKNGTFICLYILEQYMFLCNTQKQLKITNYSRNKSFFKFHLVYNGVCFWYFYDIYYSSFWDFVFTWFKKKEFDFASQLPMF